jgi:two-component system nitrogen regulation sensor histidine kinase NtrY
VAEEQKLKSVQPKKKGPRLLAATVITLIILFFAIEFFIRQEQEFSPSSIAYILLSFLQIIVLLLFLILFFVLGRNLIKLYLERKRKVIGAHFKTKLVFFFTALSLIPTLLLFIFASDLISRNIEQWFKTPLNRLMDDTKTLAEEFQLNTAETTLHYARQLSKAIKSEKLANSESQLRLREFIQEKLKEYKLDEIGVYLGYEELFSLLNLDLPLQDYLELSPERIKASDLSETLSSTGFMGKGEMIRRGVFFYVPDVGRMLVVTGKFIPQNYTQRIQSINSYIERYRQLKAGRSPLQSFYFITLSFVTLLIIFAASWIGFHLAKTITVPIEKLAQATKEVSRGNLGIRVEDPASDEIGILIDSFNQMIFDLKESQQNIAQKTSELEARKQYIETILHNITTGVISLDSQGLITTLNPSAQEMLGLPKSNHIGKSYQGVFSHPRYEEIVKNIQKGIQSEYPLSGKEITINFDGQNMTLSLALSPLKQANNQFSGLIVVLENLTQLIKAQRIAAWKEAAQMVAHEIKNPLTPIQLSAERIIKKIKKHKKDYDEAIEDGAKTIVQETSTIKTLVDEFSKFARMPEVQIQSANIHEIIDQTVSLFKGIYTGVEFELNFSPDIPLSTRTDPEQMKRVFINIFDNAIHAMNKKGSIKIRTSFNSELRKLKIEIADSGPGISARDKDKLFLPNFSTKKKGAGLGLAIVNQVISEHNGSISVEDNEPCGAKFIIQIPV